MNLLIKSDIDPKSLLGTFTVASFLMAFVSIIISHIFTICLPATVLSILFFALNLLFFRLQRIDEFSVNLKTGAVEARDDEKDTK
jgi:hypothetical protein